MKTSLALAVAVTLALGACSSDESAPTKTVTETAPSKTEDATEPDAEPADAEPADDTASDASEDLTRDFGEPYTWEDEATVTVSKPTTYKRRQYDSGGEGYATTVKLSVTIKNDGDVPLDAAYSSPSVTSGEREGDEIFSDKLSGGLESNVLPGRTATFEVAYGVDDPADIVVEFAPTWEHELAYWTSGGK